MNGASSGDGMAAGRRRSRRWQQHMMEARKGGNTLKRRRRWHSDGSSAGTDVEAVAGKEGDGCGDGARGEKEAMGGLRWSW